MLNSLDSPTFKVLLGPSAHRLAEQFRLQHRHPQKAKQVYLNTLAVSAVKFYLDCMGLPTCWEQSESWYPVTQALDNVADLVLPGLGRLDCCPILPQATVITVSPNIWLDRIGYVGVQFEAELREATLLGFVEHLEEDELPVTQLRSLDELLEHLYHLRRLQTHPTPVKLSYWLQNQFDIGWQSLTTFLAQPVIQPAFRLGSSSQVHPLQVKGVKLLDLGLQLGNQAVALLVAVSPEDHQTTTIRVQVHPTGSDLCLVPHLKLRLLAEDGKILQEVQSRSQDNFIQLNPFCGKAGENFSIQVLLEDLSITENFVI